MCCFIMRNNFTNKRPFLRQRQQLIIILLKNSIKQQDITSSSSIIIIILLLSQKYFNFFHSILHSILATNAQSVQVNVGVTLEINKNEYLLYAMHRR